MMREFMHQLAGSLGLEWLREPWLPEVFLVIVGVVGVNLVAYHLLRHAERVASRTSNNWGDAVIRAAVRPLRVVVWLVGLSFATDIIGQYTRAPIFDMVPVLRNLGVVACLAWFLVQLINNVASNYVTRREARGEEIDRTTLDALAKLGKLSVMITAALVAMQTLGFSISGILAAGGIGGIALGFAAKDLLANFFGGLTIYLDRPFSVGEWIRSPDKDIEGTVEYISWRHTRIRRFNKNPLYVPNALFTTIVVENPSRMSHRRIRETIGIRYCDLDKMAAITAEVREMLRNHPGIDANETLIVNFNEFAESSLNFFIYTFTRTRVWTEFHEVKQDVLLKVAAIISAHGAEIAFPTRTLHIESASEQA